MHQERTLSEDERAELERLRTEVAGLRSKLQEQDAAEAPAGGRGGRQGRWRTIVATLLIVLACALAPLALVAVWAKNQVTDTERYVATVAPLASDPAIQAAITNRITATVFSYIDVQGLTTEVTSALADRGLPPALASQLQALSVPIANGVESFTRSQVSKVVQSDQFANAWVQANRVAHAELVKALTGQGEAITLEGDAVRLQLGPLVERVKQELVAAGFSLAARIPQTDASLVLYQSDQIIRLQNAFNLLNILGTWLPLIVLFLLALGIYIAKDHRRALVAAGLGVAAGMVVLALLLAAFRTTYLNNLPSTVNYDAAAVLFDTIVRFLRAGLRTVLVLGLVVAAGAFLTGPSVTAVRTRQVTAGAIGSLRGSAERAGLRTGPVGTWVEAHKGALRFGAVAVASLVLVFWDRPTGRVIIGLAVLLLVVLALIEFLARPAGAGRVPEATPSG